jgi:hypothetical protein
VRGRRKRYYKRQDLAPDAGADPETYLKRAAYFALEAQTAMKEAERLGAQVPAVTQHNGPMNPGPAAPTVEESEAALRELVKRDPRRPGLAYIMCLFGPRFPSVRALWFELLGGKGPARQAVLAEVGPLDGPLASLLRRGGVC